MFGDRQPNSLYRNDGTNHHWLKVQLRPTQSNPDAIGTRLTVITPEGSRYRTISGGTGFGSMNDAVTLIGLGRATQIQHLDIRWPKGMHQRFDNLAPNQHLIITEGDATLSKHTP